MAVNHHIVDVQCSVPDYTVPQSRSPQCEYVRELYTDYNTLK